VISRLHMKFSLAVVIHARMPSAAVVALLVGTAFSWGQDSNAGPSPSFEAASVKEISPGARSIGGMPNDPVRFSQRQMTLKLLVAMACDIPDFEVSGGPAWTGLTRFDIDAKSEGPATHEQQMQMLRTLLTERFHLTYHNETRPLPVYVMSVGKNGPKLGPPFHLPKEGDPGPVRSPGTVALRLDMKRFAAVVTQYLKIRVPSSGEVLSPPEPLPVIDQTGLTGEYDITVDLRSNGDWFAALDEQLGLRLEARKAPLRVLVIDTATMPTSN
jgi:uncharacterized protein (TIGR03435 family)